MTEGNGPVEIESELSPRPRGLLRATIGPAGKKWILTLTDQAIVSGAGFLASVIIGRACGKEGLGLYVLGMTIVGLMIEVQNVVIWSPYTVFSPHMKGSAHAFYTGSTLIHQCFLSVLGVLVLAGSGVLLSRGRSHSGLETFIWVLAISGSFLLFREYARRICFAGFWMRAVLWLDFEVAVLQSVALLLLAYGGKLSASSALGVIGLACGLAGLSWFIGNWRAFQFSITQAASDFRRNWSFGKWLLVDNLAFFVSCELYPWVLSAFHGTAEVGVLAACQRVVTFTGPFLQGCLNILPAKAAHACAHGGRQELWALVVKSTVVISGVVSLLCAALMLFGGQLVEFLYGPQYAGNSLLISILALNILVYALSLGMKVGLLALGRADLNLRVNLLRLAVTFTLGLWLVKAFGPLGVAWGLLLGSLGAIAVQYSIFIKYFIR